jgi:hypothetical protein
MNLIEPRRIISFLVLLYLFAPLLGSYFFPDYFNFSYDLLSYLILCVFILCALVAGKLSKKIKLRLNNSLNFNHLNPHPHNLPAKSIFYLNLLLCLIFFYFSSKIRESFSLSNLDPFNHRIFLKENKDFLIIICSNLFTSLALSSSCLAILFYKNFKNKKFIAIWTIFFGLIYLSGYRSYLLLSFIPWMTYLNLNQLNKILFFIFFSTIIFLILLLGIIRQGSDISILNLIWQFTARFDMFFPQFLNFLDRYLDQSIYPVFNSYQILFPIQIFPSSFFNFLDIEKPVTFLEFVNREFMSVPDSVGMDFSAFAEFIFNNGIILGFIFYFFYAFFLAIVVNKFYEKINFSTFHFLVYPQVLLLYISMLWFSGISSQANIFLFSGIIFNIFYYKLLFRVFKARF